MQEKESIGVGIRKYFSEKYHNAGKTSIIIFPYGKYNFLGKRNLAYNTVSTYFNKKFLLWGLY